MESHTVAAASRRSASTRSRRSSSCSRASRPTRLSDAFYSRLCEATCRLADMDRAVIFRYDGARRRVRAAGAYGIPLETFADAQVTVETVPVARESLRRGPRDRDLERDGRGRPGRVHAT